MYYYAYLDENNYVVSVHTLPSQISLPEYVEITYSQYSDPNLIGMYWNGSSFEEVNRYFYALLDSDDVVIEVYEGSEGEAATDVIAIDSLDTSLIGKWYNRTTQQFTDVPIHILAAHSTDEINVGTADEWLTDRLEDMQTAIDGKAATNHAHTGYAATGHTHTGYANASHTHTASDITGLPSSVDAYSKTEIDAMLDDYSEVGHTHSGYATATSVSALETAVNSKADASHTHTGFAEAEHTHSQYLVEDDISDFVTESDMNTALSGKADTGHSHSNYALASDLSSLSTTVNGKADASHTHSGYASSNHSHSGYASSSHSHTASEVGAASSSHSHSEYLSSSGGTVSGNLNVTGILRVNGQQSVYDSGTMVTLSTNNRQTMIAGSAIYSKVQIAVSSDERLKENIQSVNADEMADFINAIDVKTFNYIGNDKECIGAIAQQIQEANPDVAKYLVSENEDGYLSIKVADLVFPLIVAVQELKKEIDILKK